MNDTGTLQLLQGMVGKLYRVKETLFLFESEQHTDAYLVFNGQQMLILAALSAIPGGRYDRRVVFGIQYLNKNGDRREGWFERYTLDIEDWFEVVT